MKVINLFAGPGAGKSTTAAGLFYAMKLQQMSVELVTEYAKAMTWERRDNVLSDQLYMFAKQHRTVARLRGHVEYVVTDSPLLLSTVYLTADYPASFEKMVIEFWNTYDNCNFFLERHKPYVKLGRRQNEDEARAIDDRTRAILDRYNVPYTVVRGDHEAPAKILAVAAAAPPAP